MTIFEVDKSKGDIVAIVTATAISPRAGGGIIEYVATFPNVTVNTGAEYRACVITTMGLELTCTTGNNSPATRPEFVDISAPRNL